MELKTPDPVDKTSFTLELLYGILLGGVVFACAVFILLALQDIENLLQQQSKNIFTGNTFLNQLIGICGAIIVINCCRVIMCSHVKIIGVVIGIAFTLLWFDAVFLPNAFPMF